MSEEHLLRILGVAIMQGAVIVMKPPKAVNS